MIQTTGTDGSKKPIEEPAKKKKRSLADALLNVDPNLNASASSSAAIINTSSIANSVNNALNPAAANNSISSAAITSARPNKKKRRTKDEHFKSDYASEMKQALTKLNNKNFNPSRLSKKDCCSILWEITTEFHKDTEKDFDAKTALKNAIENYPHFRDVFALKLDSLTYDMIE